MRPLEAFEEDHDFVLKELEAGFVDHIEVVSRVVETQFFQEFIGSGALAKLAETYPTPRQKEEVPLWIYLATQLTLRLHGASGFASLPYILHCGGLRDALEKGQVERKRDVGRATDLDLSLVRADLATAEDVLRETVGGQKQARRAIEVLLGRYPSAEIVMTDGLVAVPSPISVDFPADLVASRPDLNAAEQLWQRG